MATVADDVTALNAALDKIAAEITQLQSAITALQTQVANSSVTPEVQAALDAVVVRANSLATVVPPAA